MADWGLLKYSASNHQSRCYQTAGEKQLSKAKQEGEGFPLGEKTQRSGHPTVAPARGPRPGQPEGHRLDQMTKKTVTDLDCTPTQRTLSAETRHHDPHQERCLRRTLLWRGNLTVSRDRKLFLLLAPRHLQEKERASAGGRRH